MPVKHDQSRFTVGANSAEAQRKYLDHWDETFKEARRKQPEERKADLTKYPIIVRNAIRCRACGDEIESTHRHDFKFCGCGAVAVDGGHDYLRRIGSRDDVEETSVTEPWVEPMAGDELEFLVPTKTLADVTYDIGDRLALLEPSKTNFRDVEMPNCWRLGCKHFPSGTVWQGIDEMIRSCKVRLIRHVGEKGTSR